MLLGVFELLFSILISVYENSITVSLVAPLVPKPFSNTRELYNNNYTLVVQTDSFTKVYNWLSYKYNTENQSKVLGVENFLNITKWLESLFLKHRDETKYAIIGWLSQHFDYQAVTFVRGRIDTCYQMFPTEVAFHPESFYIGFASAVASSLQKGVSVLQAGGFFRVIETSQHFREHLLAITHARRLVAKYEIGISRKDLENNRLKENMISLGNIESILFVGLIVILSATFAFVAEVGVFYHYTLVLKITIWVNNGVKALFRLVINSRKGMLKVAGVFFAVMCVV